MNRSSASVTALALTWMCARGVAAGAATATTPAPPSTPPPAPAPTPPTPGSARGAPVVRTPLPAARTVDAILADAVEAIGGAAALGRHRSLRTKMEITFKGLGITGTAAHTASVGDKALTVTEIPSLASTREGSDGTRFWSEDPINGLRMLDGAEAEQARIEGSWNPELRMKELFEKIEAKNERTGDTGYLECLFLTPKLAPMMTNCFDPKTHLLAMQKGLRSGPQGDMPFTARLSDWRKVDDIKMAYATDMQVGPLAFTGRVTSVEMDVPVDAHLFDVPRVPGPQGARAGVGSAATSGTPGRTRGKTGGKPDGTAKR
jgi:hypothetical protein